MSCNHPFKGFDLGTFTENGKRNILLYPSTAGDLVSIESASRRVQFIGASAPMKKIGNKVYLCDPIAIPCGSCSGCRMDRAKEWKTRICLEAEKYPGRSWFLTLTYDDAHLPRLKDGRPYLNKSDLQKFMKRLRKYSGIRFRYFACGEYGSLTGRPHFHLILFGDLPVETRMSGENRYFSDIIEKAWKFGLYDLQRAEPGSIAYTAGYVEKKQVDPNFDKYPVKPFILMSRRPGIGADAIKPLGYDFKVYGDFGGTHQSALPQYFKKKLENDPLYPELEKRSIERGKESSRMAVLVYGTHDQDVQGFAKDAVDLVKLKNKSKGESL